LISSRETLPRCLAWQRIRITIENVRVDSPRRPEKRRINESPRTSPISISIIKKRLAFWFRRKCARAFNYTGVISSGQPLVNRFTHRSLRSRALGAAAEGAALCAMNPSSSFSLCTR
jgi:hypothetical protein